MSCGVRVTGTGDELGAVAAEDSIGSAADPSPPAGDPEVAGSSVASGEGVAVAQVPGLIIP